MRFLHLKSVIIITWLSEEGFSLGHEERSNEAELEDNVGHDVAVCLLQCLNAREASSLTNLTLTILMLSFSA